MEENKAVLEEPAAAQQQSHAHHVVSIYDRYSRFVYDTACSVLGKGPAAEEVCLEVFTSLFYSGSRELTVTSLPRHLYIVTRVCAKVAARRLNQGKVATEDDGPDWWIKDARHTGSSKH
jgi:hypothetical protein